MKARSSHPLLTVLIALVLLAAPMAARAQAQDTAPGSDPARFSMGKFLDLAACAVSIAVIETGIGATMAFLTCGKAATEWWTE